MIAMTALLTLLATQTTLAADSAAGAPAVDDVTPWLERSLLRASDTMLLANVAVASVHQADHMLRQHVDVALFYPSFALQPIQLGLYVFDAGPLLTVPVEAAFLFLHLNGHVVFADDIDSTHGAYEQWAHGHNALGVESRELGLLSNGLSWAMIGTSAAHLALAVTEGFVFGWTVIREPRGASPSPSPSPSRSSSSSAAAAAAAPAASLMPALSFSFGPLGADGAQIAGRWRF